MSLNSKVLKSPLPLFGKRQRRIRNFVCLEQHQHQSVFISGHHSWKRNRRFWPKMDTTAKENQTGKDSVFQPLDASNLDNVPMEIESFCVQCEENGTTRLLLTKIPFYKDVILMSFHCPHCEYRNNEIQSGGKAQEHGIRYVVKIKNQQDLNRQVVKSEFGGVTIPEIEFEIPQKSQAGEVTTVEGVINRASEAIKYGQEARRKLATTQAQQLDEFLSRLDSLLRLEREFTFIVDDPSGNSYVENPNPSQIDKQTTIIHYHRTLQQEKLLGFVADDVEETQENGEEAPPVWESKEELRNEVLHFQVNCSNCNAFTNTNMKIVNIPYFKEVIVMATTCDSCGVRTSEVKSGSGIAEKGIKLTLHVAVPSEDMTRDVLKSETCSLEIPELELEMGMGILGGRFTTVEGVFTAIKEELIDKGGFALGDSAEAPKRQRMNDFMSKLDQVINGEMPVHLVLDDIAGNSYIQSLTAPDPDPRLTVEYYERNWEQNDDLGLNDMRVDNENTDGDANVEG